MSVFWNRFLVALVLLLAVGQGAKCQDEEEEEPHCETTRWSRRGGSCSRGYTEMYREESFGSVRRFCCPTATKLEREQKDAAYVCQTTSCQSATSTGDLCSTLNARYVANERLVYEETLRDNCALEDWEGDEEPGITAMCCVHNSTAGLLLTTYGAEKNEFPHMAALSVGCGGTIYNRRYIITASHCLVEDHKVISADNLKITLGTGIGGYDGLGSANNSYQAEEIIVHEEYSDLARHPEQRKPENRRRTYNDIALIRLDREIEFGPRIKALEIAPNGFNAFEYADNAVIAGWGTADNLQVTQALQKSNFLLRSDKACFQRGGKWPQMRGMDDQLLCVGGIMLGYFSPSAGGGDSGGPAICRGKDGKIVLCGVTSFGGSDEDCSEHVSEGTCPPSVYAEVQHFHEWIKRHAGEQERSTLYKPFLYGEPVARKMYGSQVHITSSRGKPCGGTLISKDIVLTAAQCVADPDSGDMLDGLEVTSGVRDLRGGRKGKSFGVKRMAVLEGFKRVGRPIDPARQGKRNGYTRLTISDNYYRNDLAVVKLAGRMNIEERQLPEIPSFRKVPSKYGTEVSLPRNTSRSGQLQQRRFKLLDLAECQTRMSRMERAGLKIKVDKNLICGVEKYSGGSVCDRELGGGLFCKGDGKKDVLCGVQVFRLCEWSVPNGFMNTALYKGWIEAASEQL